MVFKLKILQTKKHNKDRFLETLSQIFRRNKIRNTVLKTTSTYFETTETYFQIKTGIHVITTLTEF